MSVSGRPASPGRRLTSFVIPVVYHRRLSRPSRKTVAMLVLFSRFFMSSLTCERSATRLSSSVLTVWSSSLSDCISSFEVVSSSLVDWSSSFVDWSSSLVDFSSSCEDCISSRVVCRSSSA